MGASVPMTNDGPLVVPVAVALLEPEPQPAVSSDRTVREERESR